MSNLTIKDVARQLCDGLNLNINDITNRLEKYLKNNPMTLKELNEKCWNDSTEIFDSIM
jgi:hypothetical protein